MSSIPKPIKSPRNKGRTEYAWKRQTILAGWWDGIEHQALDGSKALPCSLCHHVGTIVRRTPESMNEVKSAQEAGQPGMWYELGGAMEVGHKHGRLTHRGAPVRDKAEGVQPECRLCNAYKAGNRYKQGSPQWSRT